MWQKWKIKHLIHHCCNTIVTNEEIYVLKSYVPAYQWRHHVVGREESYDCKHHGKTCFPWKPCCAKQNITDGQTDKRTTDKGTPMWHFASLEPQKQYSTLHNVLKKNYINHVANKELFYNMTLNTFISYFSRYSFYINEILIWFDSMIR